ncbi:hypothetical protein [Pseudomonas oryzihabitans]|uniref:hypothetical protein n=1 Tax=Pseudomonas oryzihabitans TaxID=47885 RepID=UPI0028944F9E|nr:hypothetical protein [Pseudomonas oryzihabitans]MDT3720344.1 hypothetical protein [Pseudomonas oryzihabitans]
MTTKTVIVKFTNAWQGYAAGETAGFDEDKAKALEEAGFATIEKKAAPRAARGGAATTSANNVPPENIPGANGDLDVPGGAGKAEDGVPPGDPNANADANDDKKP